MLADRKFHVHLNGKVSKYKYLQNSLPQDCPFSNRHIKYNRINVYTADISSTISRKCMYVDNVGLVDQVGTFEELENILNKDLTKVHIFLKSWHLTLLNQLSQPPLSST